MKQREYAIDFLKFFAALLITNSHLDVFEPNYPIGTGGSIGDVLFLFCSGYTLFMGNMKRFDNWYKRRLSRIFPPVICWGIISAFCFGAQDTIDNIIVEGGGWFVQCILIYYILAYPIRMYATRYLWSIFGVVAIIVCIWFFLMPRGEDFNLYGWNYCKWAAFFLFFLQGAYKGFYSSCRRFNFVLSLGTLIGCILIWYGMLFLQQKLQLPNSVQLLSLIPLLGISYSFFQWCKSDLMESIFYSRYLNPLFRTIGGLCFEIYLVQYTLFYHIQLQVTYPYNIVIIWVLIFFWAYVLHIFNNFFIQTIKDGDYDWKNIFRIF